MSGAEADRGRGLGCGQESAKGVDGGGGEVLDVVLEDLFLERLRAVENMRKIGIAFAPDVNGSAVDAESASRGGDGGAGEQELDGLVLGEGEFGFHGVVSSLAKMKRPLANAAAWVEAGLSSCFYYDVGVLQGKSEWPHVIDDTGDVVRTAMMFDGGFTTSPRR